MPSDLESIIEVIGDDEWGDSIHELIEFDINSNIVGPSKEWDSLLSEMVRNNKRCVKCFYKPISFDDRIGYTLLDKVYVIADALSDTKYGKIIKDISIKLSKRYYDSLKECKRDFSDEYCKAAIAAAYSVPSDKVRVKEIAQEIIKRSDIKDQKFKQKLIDNFDLYYDCPIFTKYYIKDREMDINIKFDDDFYEPLVEYFNNNMKLQGLC